MRPSQGKTAGDRLGRFRHELDGIGCSVNGEDSFASKPPELAVRPDSYAVVDKPSGERVGVRDHDLSCDRIKPEELIVPKAID